MWLACACRYPPTTSGQHLLDKYAGEPQMVLLSASCLLKCSRPFLHCSCVGARSGCMCRWCVCVRHIMSLSNGRKSAGIKTSASAFFLSSAKISNPALHFNCALSAAQHILVHCVRPTLVAKIQNFVHCYEVCAHAFAGTHSAYMGPKQAKAVAAA